ncbi:hypothetical protein KJ644_04905, partial [Candidatus Dependentiae bacterium]|nr:hypothetical protein [Candidatus Dependentiae bacterium]MCG2676539.1 hypothetical protein [bacterium]
MLQKKENLEEIKELRRFYLSEYRKDKADFRKRSQKDKEKKKFPPTLSKANKIRFYFISKEEYFPCLIKQTKKELEKSEPTS